MNAEYRLASLLRGMTGINIDPGEKYQFEQRFAPLMRDHNVSGYAEMADKIAQNRDLRFLNRVIEQVAAHGTRFFRDESFFSAFARQIIPGWLGRVSDHESPWPRRIRIWSAGCSTGQEIWSIAIQLAEHFPFLSGRVQLYASDINAESLQRAEDGLYSPFEISRGMPSHLLLKYFTVDGNGFRIDRRKLAPVEFFKANLLKDPVPVGMDIVLCRNVISGLAEADKKMLFAKFRRRISPNGLLVLGASESAGNCLAGYVQRDYGLARYYEIKRNGTTARHDGSIVN